MSWYGYILVAAVVLAGFVRLMLWLTDSGRREDAALSEISNKLVKPSLTEAEIRGVMDDECPDMSAPAA